MSDGDKDIGQQGITSGNSQFNAVAFIVRQALGRMQTATVVKVVKVAPGDDPVGPVGTVDVLPLVNQTDGNGNVQKHVTVYGLPYSRIQGGTNAVIMDPKVGDLGIAVFASRDISSVKANKGQANPGSRRRYDLSDGMYIGGILNGTPTQYVRFHGEGIDITTPLKVTVNATGDVNVNAGGKANVTATGNANVKAASVISVGPTYLGMDAPDEAGGLKVLLAGGLLAKQVWGKPEA